MSCECYQVGGPWIAEDPSCPLHGIASEGREERIQAIVEQAASGEISASRATELIMSEFMA